MRRRFAAFTVATATAIAVLAPPAQAAPAPAPMRQVALTPAPGTALVFGSSTADFVPSIIASIAASVALTLLLNSGSLSAAAGAKTPAGSTDSFGSTASKPKAGESGSVAIKIKTGTDD